MNKNTISKWFSMFLLMMVAGITGATAQSLTVADFSLEKGQMTEVNIKLAAPADQTIYGVQTDITLSEGLILEEVAAVNAELQFDKNIMAGGATRVALLSLAGSSIPAGDVIKLHVKAADTFAGGTISLTNSKLTISAAGAETNVESSTANVTKTSAPQPVPVTATFNFADPTFREKIGTAMTDVEGYIYDETFTAEGATLQITAGSAPSRIYTDANRGQCLVLYNQYGALTFKAPEGKAIVQIDFTAAGNSNINKLTPSSGAVEGMVWTGNAEGVRFTQGATSYLANAVLTLVDKTDETAALPAIEYTECANIAAFNALAAGTYAKITLTNAEVIGKSADGYSTVWMQDATGGCWIQYTSLNDKLTEKTKVNGTIYTIKRETSGNPQMKEAEATLQSELNATAIESYTAVAGTIAEVNVAANLNKVVKIAADSLVMTKASSGTLYVGETSITVNNGTATANQLLCKIADWEQGKKLENITIEAILSASSATANQLLPISITEDAPAPEKFAIMIAETENGSAVAEPTEAAAGETVKVTVTPAEGYKVDEASIVDAAGNVIEFQIIDETHATFVMPASAVKINFTFKETSVPELLATVKMTYVDADQADTAIGEVEVAKAGFNKIVDGQVGFGNTDWACNWITYLQVDASAYQGVVKKAILTADVSGSTDSKRTTTWGVGYNNSVWSANMTYNTADKSITLTNDPWTGSTKSAETFEEVAFDITAAFANSNVATILVYETAAAGGFIKNPKVTLEMGDREIEVNGIVYAIKSDNLITNGSFDQGFTGWTQASDFATEITSDGFEIRNEEGHSTFLVGTKNEGAGGNNSLGTAWNIEPGKTYYYAFDVKSLNTESGEATYLKSSLTNTKGEEASMVGMPQVTPGEWTSFKKVFTNEEYQFLQAKFRWLAGNFGLDNFELYEVEMLTSALDAAKNTKIAAIDALAPIGEGLFFYSQRDIDAAKGAVAAAESIEALDAIAMPAPTTPAADKAYSFLNKQANLYMTLSADGISIAEEPYELKFETAEGGKYYVTDGTNYVGIAGTDNWTMTTEAGKKEALTIAATVIDGAAYYTLAESKGLVGVDYPKKENMGCWANKGTGDGDAVLWTIAEYVAPPVDSALIAAKAALQAIINADKTIVTEGQQGADAFATAITTAETAANAKNATVESIAAARAALASAVATFTKANLGSEFVEIEQTQSPEISDGASRATVVEGDGYTQYTTDGGVCVIIKKYDIDVKDCDYVTIKFAEPLPNGINAAFWAQSGTDNVGMPAGTYEYKYVFADDAKCAIANDVLPQLTLLTLWNSQTVNIVGVYKHKNAIPELAQTLNVERYAGLGYTAQEATVDFTEAKTFLGVEAITTDMLRIVNPDGTQISDYAPFDGWFNGEGAAETWGANTKVCVKFFQAIPEGKFEICDMNGADSIGATYTVKWALVANDKQVTYTINVKFVEKPVVDLKFADLSVMDTKTVALTSELGKSYEGLTADVDVAAILTKLGVTSLNDVTIYAVQTDGSLDDNYKLGTTDGWRDSTGNWQTWGDNAYFFVKADFTKESAQIYDAGGMDGKNTTAQWQSPATYTATYAFVKTGTADAVVLKVTLTYTVPTGINAIARDGQKSVIYNINGQKVNKAQKGLFIINGKKTVVR